MLRREALQVVIALAQTKGAVRTTLPNRNPERPFVTDARSPSTADDPAATPATELRTTPKEATPPVLIAEPILPEEFLLGNENGFVVLELSIDSDGRIVQVVTLDTDLANEYATAIESISRGALFEPARLGGKAAPGRSVIRFEYHPAEPEPLRFQWIPNYQLNSG